MQALFERLLDLIERWISFLLPWVILDDDRCGLIRRLGKYHRDLHHGWNWKWPVVEQAMTDLSALETTVLREQTLTTKDGQQVTVRGVITYQVVNPRKYIIECGLGPEVINDIACATIGEVIPTFTLAQVLHDDGFSTALSRRVKARGTKRGIEVESVGLVDRVATSTLRIIGDRVPVQQ